MMDAAAKEARMVTLRESWARVRPRVSRSARADLDRHIRRQVKHWDRFYRSLIGRANPEPELEVVGEELREFDAGHPQRVDVLVPDETRAAP